MNLFLYLDRESPVHRLDPRTKIFLLLGSFVAAVLFVFVADVAWEVVVVIAVGSVIGAQVGAHVGRRLSPRVLRTVVVVVGVVAAVKLLVT